MNLIYSKKKKNPKVYKRKNISKNMKKGNGHPTKHKHHPIFRKKLTLGQKASDLISNFGGSWTFITIFILFLIAWMIMNFYFLTNKGFDPYPFILLNLVLSCLAALQAPIILMAQNRQAENDRIDAKYDHAINRKAEREIQNMQQDLEDIKAMIKHIKKKV